MSASRLVNRNVTANGGRTSMRLEPEIWDALKEICARERIGITDLVKQVDGDPERGGRTSAMRIFIFRYFRNAANEDGHAAAGHGRLST